MRIILTLALLFTLTGCGDSDRRPDDPDPSGSMQYVAKARTGWFYQDIATGCLWRVYRDDGNSRHWTPIACPSDAGYQRIITDVRANADRLN